MPPYPIEIINLGNPDFTLHEEIIKSFNNLQKSFVFFSPPERLKSWGSVFKRENYEGDEVYELLEQYQLASKEYCPFLIAIIHSQLEMVEKSPENELRKWTNLFGACRISSQSSMAIITTADWEEYFSPPPLSAYLAYYIFRYTVDFIMHKDMVRHMTNQGCIFDFNQKKDLVKISMQSGKICDACRKILEKKLDGSIYESLEKLSKFIKDESVGISKKNKPRMFIGSSTEGVEIAEAIQLNLEQTAECTIWTQGVFGPSTGNLESLLGAVSSFDYAILVFTPDDPKIKRNTKVMSPRDNVIFELGLFIGKLGPKKTFIVCNGEKDIDVLSDLEGFTPATFVHHSDGNTQAALGAACTRIKKAMNLI